MFFVGCGNAEDADTDAPELGSSQQALKEHYDGETLLRGLFFGRGPVAAALPEIWSKAPLSQQDAADAFRSGMRELERSADIAKYDEEVLKLIESKESKTEKAADEAASLAISLLVKRDPGFPKHFESAIYSGDPVRVSDAIEEAAKHLNELIEVEIIRDLGRYGADWLINENAVINVNAAINVNVAVNVDTAYNMVQFWSLELDRASMLRNEMMVATITARFAR
jgi:SdpC family antimicrobial peptide